MGCEIRFVNQCVEISAGRRCFAFDAGQILLARIYDSTLTREYTTSDFRVAQVYPLPNGIRLLMINERDGLVIPVTFKADGDGFRVIVHAGHIVETKGINRKLMAVDVLPDMMTSQRGDSGFFLLPCFSGTLVRFKDHCPTINRDRIYMDQSEWEKVNLANCFAMNRSGEGILAIVHQGDFFCHVVTELNQAGKNRIYPRFGLRHDEGEAIKQQDKEIIYRFAEGEQAKYPGLAMLYRDYLIRERGVSPLKERVADNPVLSYSVDALRTKVYMGEKPGVIDGNAPMRVDTTFEQTETILQSMHEAGIKKAIITLVGWNLGGHDGAYPTRFPVEPALGGEECLKKLIAKALSLGYQIVTHDNCTDMYRSARDWDSDYTARTAEGRQRVSGVWTGGQAFKACPIVYTERYGAEFERIRELGFQGNTYVDAISTVLWRCHDPRHPADEEQYCMAQSAMVQWHRAMYGAVAIELGPAYALPFIDEISTLHGAHNAPGLLNYLSEDFKRIVDEIVPFYQIAVHGLVTYLETWVDSYRDGKTGTWRGMLQAMGVGARPCMQVSWAGGGYGDVYYDSIRDVLPGYKMAYEELAGVHSEFITAYEELAPKARRLVFGNGLCLEVNWGDDAVGDLRPLSYRVTH